MNEQKTSTRQALSLYIMFLVGQVLILYNGNPAKNDIWISILMAYAVSIPLSLLNSRLVTVFPGKDPFDLQLELFGPFFGRAFVLAYSMFYLHISSLVLKDMTNFIHVTSLTETPQIISAVMIGVLCVYVVKAGINTLARYAAIALPVYFLIILGTMLLATTLWTDLSHLGPVLYNGFKPVLKSAVDLAAFPFADAAVIPYIIQPLKKNRKALTIFLAGNTIATVFFLLVFLQNILVLGSNFTFTQFFPSYIMVSLIDIADFLQRIEVAIGAILFMGVFIKITVYLYIASLGLSKLLSIGDYRKFAAPVGMLAVALSLFAYPNMLVNIAFASNIYPYYALVMDVILPMALWLAAETRRKKLAREGRLPEPPAAGTETPVARQGGGMPQNPDGAGKQPQPT